MKTLIRHALYLCLCAGLYFLLQWWKMPVQITTGTLVFVVGCILLSKATDFAFGKK